MGSKFHERIRDLVKRLLGTGIREEVNVKKLFPEYSYTNHHYDLVVNSYNLIIECHGEQHRNITPFGNILRTPIGGEKTIVDFYRQKHRDSSKETIARENDWCYLRIWYNDLPKGDDEAMEFLREEISKVIGNTE